MTLEEWKTFVDTLKAALESLAIFGVGAWALFTFRSLGQIARAKAEITKLDFERRKTEAEVDRLAEQARVGAVIQISLDAVSRTVYDHHHRFVEITVEIFNGGSRNVHIAYPEYPLIVYGASVSAEGAMSYHPVATARVVSGVNPNGFSSGMLARAGGRYPLSFMVTVPSPGLYLAIFSVPLSEA